MTDTTHARAAPANKSTRVTFWLLAFAFLMALFNHGLVPSMEPRFAEVVREMMAAGEWIIPIKNGKPYVEYPIFYYWLAIIGKTIGLPMTAAIRLPTFLAFLGWLLLLGRWQRLLFPDLEKYAFQVAGAALPLVIFQFSIAQTDGMLVFGVMMSLFGYTKLTVGQSRGEFPWALWGGIGIAVLAKGPVGIACTLPVILADRVILVLRVSSPLRRGKLVDRAILALRELCLVRGVALLVLVSVPWYIAAGLRSGWEFVEAVLVYQNFDRYVTGYSHNQPWWYYFKTITYDFFPLSLVLPVGLWVGWQQRTRPVIRVVLIWCAFTFVFFSVSGSKQGKYLLPMAPAIVALAFIGIGYIRDRFNIRLHPPIRLWSLALISIFSVLMIFVVPFYSSKIGGADGFQPIRTQVAEEPGEIIHFQWPRSLTLYELGAPMPYVRSSRELYSLIRSGRIGVGSYVLVRSDSLDAIEGADNSLRLAPYPNSAFFEVVLETKAEKAMTLLRIIEGADQAITPVTPEPRVLHWRDAMFDTD